MIDCHTLKEYDAFFKAIITGQSSVYISQTVKEAGRGKVLDVICNHSDVWSVERT